MAALQDEVWAVLRRDGVVARREHPELGGAIDWLLRNGRVAGVLPGVYAATEHAREHRVQLAAVSRWSPDAVITGGACARLLFWPDAPLRDIEVATRRRGRYPGFRLVDRRLPPELVHDWRGLRLATPALAALDLADEAPDGIDHVLRSRTATLDGLWQAFELTKGRRGNTARLAHLIDSRDEPWSAAERLCHRMLRDAGITGWQSNLPVRCGGRLFYLDVAFPEVGLVVEIDGRLHEGDRAVFENDRWRQNGLVLDGWVVVRVTWAMLVEHPDSVLGTIRAALAMAGSARPLTFRGSIRHDGSAHAQRRRRRPSSRHISGERALSGPRGTGPG